MSYLAFLASFAAGLFLSNAIPHLAAGLRGEPFPSPFASPPGKGNSSPVVNAVWGTFNLFVSGLLYSAAPFALDLNIPTILFFAGFLFMSIFSAWNFGKVRNP